jgi:hypothetical protein
MKKETYNRITKVLEVTSLRQKFIDTFDNWEEMFCDANGLTDTIEYALMFHLDTNEIFILPYANPDNNWADIAEQQNPWIRIAYISAADVHFGNIDILENIEINY